MYRYTKKARPFFVKPAGREVCVCIYHLRFDIFVETIYNYVKRLRGDLKQCSCQHVNHKSPIDFRRGHVCQRTTSERYDDVPCVVNKCEHCKDLRMFTLCKCSAAHGLPNIKAQVWEKFDYTLKDGTVKQKRDFVPRELEYTAWEKLFRAYWPKFALHHDVGKWQVSVRVLYVWAMCFLLNVNCICNWCVWPGRRDSLLQSTCRTRNNI